MASIVDRSGVQVEAPLKLAMDDDAIEMTRDLIIVRLRGEGLSFAMIGRVMNLTKQGVHYRYAGIPQEVRRHYVALPMG